MSYSDHLSAQTAMTKLDRAEPFFLHIFNVVPDEELARRRQAALESDGSAATPPPSGWDQHSESMASSAGGGNRSSEAAAPPVGLGRGRPMAAAAYTVGDRMARAVGGAGGGVGGGGGVPGFNGGGGGGGARLEPKVFGYPLVISGVRPKPCSFCEVAEGRLRCSRCKAWYCSQKCQIEDWQEHKPFCIEPPMLEHPDGSVPNTNFDVCGLTK